MTVPTNTLDTYDVNTNLEDLSDIIFDISPDETPTLTMMKKEKASNVKHEWSIESLGSSQDNFHIEGDEGQAGDQITPPSRVNNICQILKKKIVISGTQQKGMTTAGISDYLAHEKAKKMKEIKLDLERHILGGGTAIGVAKVNVDGSARKSGTLQTYIKTNASVGSGGAVSAGDGSDAMTSGTNRAFSQAILDTVLQDCFLNGAKPTSLVMSPVNRKLFSGFTGSTSRYQDDSDKKLVNTIDVYVGDYHTLKAVPSREISNEVVFALNPEYLANADLRALSCDKLGKTGDNLKEEMVWETTTKVCNEAAHAVIADLNG